MTRRELGAGVSVMWVIFLIVMLIGAGAYIYLVQADLQTAANKAQKAEDRAKEAEEQLDTARSAHSSLSQVVGFQSGENFSNVPGIETRLGSLRDRFKQDVGDGDNTLELVVEKLVAMADRLDQEAQAARTQFTSERDARQSTEASKSTIQSNLDSTIASLNGNLRDARDSAQQAQSTADGRYSDLQDSLNQANTAAREREDELQAQVAETESEVSKFKNRTEVLARKAELIGNPEDPMEPDGKVLAAGAGMAVIDIGGRDLLLPGVRFDVYYYGKGGERIPKGTLEVRTVESQTAECAVLSELDELDPIAKNDIVANPQFSRNRSRVFVLIGEFPAYGKSFLKRRLEDLGAKVVDEVTADVDFVVLGTKAADEDALEPTELPEYKTAQELRVQPLRLRDIEHFLMP